MSAEPIATWSTADLEQPADPRAPRVLSAAATARILGIGETTLRNKHDRGELGFRALPGGGRLKFSERTVLHYLEHSHDQPGCPVCGGAS